MITKAYRDGIKNGKIDARIVVRNNYAWFVESAPSYSRDYSLGYRLGYLMIKRKEK